MTEGFLSRWARLKRHAEAPADADKLPAGSNPAAAVSGADETAAGNLADKPWAGRDPSLGPVDFDAMAGGREVTQPVGPDLPDIATLNPSSDFRPFMQAAVPQASRNAALKKLFADPAFNVMDGLDTYIDDYSQADPIPAGMLKDLMARHLADTVQELVPTGEAGSKLTPGLANGTSEAPRLEGAAEEPATATATAPAPVAPGPRIAPTPEKLQVRNPGPSEPGGA